MQSATPYVAIACGGTGGHLFPGLAVAEALQQKGCEIALLISTKEVDQEAVKSALCTDILKLPAIALQDRRVAQFVRGFWQSCRVCWTHFKKRAPRAILAMGGFTSAPPVLTGKLLGASAFLHESNAIPGRANRWLSPLVDTAFVGFAKAGRLLHTQSVQFTGTPVRPQFKPAEPGPCRIALGLHPDRPVLLITGGSQGASGINDLVCRTLPRLAERCPALQYFHLTGTADLENVRAAYSALNRRAIVQPFLTEMDLALGAATAALSRAGASSLAELAAMQVPPILIPYPAAADDHQYYNAHAFMETGAARQLDQASATPEHLAQIVIELTEREPARTKIRAALEQWHFPNAADDIAEGLLRRIGLTKPADSIRRDSPVSTRNSSTPQSTAPNPDLKFQISNLKLI